MADGVTVYLTSAAGQSFSKHAWAFEGNKHKDRGTGLSLPTGRQLQCLLAMVTQAFCTRLRNSRLKGGDVGVRVRPQRSYPVPLASLVPKVASFTDSMPCSSWHPGRPSFLFPPGMPVPDCSRVCFPDPDGLNLSLTCVCWTLDERVSLYKTLAVVPLAVCGGGCEAETGILSWGI